MKLSIIPIAAMLALAVTSCKKDNNVAGQIGYRIKPANFTAALAGTKTGATVSSANTITWTSGSMIVSEIDFEAESENLEVEYELKQVNTVDLFNLSPVLGTVTIPDGTYNEVELKLDLRKKTTGAAPLILKGDYYDASGVKTPIEFHFDENIEIEVEAENVVISSQDYTGIINIQLNKLLTNVTASDLSEVSKINGKIIVDGTANTSLYNKMKTNFNFIGDCDFD